MPKAPLARLRAALDEHAAEDVLALDRVVGRQDEHHLVLGAVDGERGERDRRGRVPALGLGDDAADTRHLPRHESGVALIRHDVHVADIDERVEPRDRPLEQRLVDRAAAGTASGDPAG